MTDNQELTPHSMKPNKLSEDRITLLRSLIGQSYDVFNIYGKTPESLKNYLMAFEIVLNGCSVDSIKMGFLEWLKTSDKMPTPADIYKNADFWDKSKNRSQENFKNNAVELNGINVKPWYNKTYIEIDEQTKADLKNHVKNMRPDKLENYVLYMTNHMGYNRQQLGLCG